MTTRTQLRSGVTAYAVIAATILILAAFALGAYAIVQLQGMASNLQRVDSRLSALQRVDSKLDGLRAISGSLGTMKGQLNQTNSSLLKTNHLLVKTNTKLGATNSKLNSTERSIQSLSSIRGDIHEMSRKISGSFLLRGVK